MSVTLQWVICSLIGAAALFYLLRSAGLLGHRPVSAGHCAKCHVADRMVEALNQATRDSASHR